MIVIGVTGGIGAGKSAVCGMFKKLGAKIIDADKISHQIMEPETGAYNEILEAFSLDVVGADKKIDRKKLAGIVFSDKAKLDTLNEITHKYIFDEMRNQLSKLCESDTVILDVPLLFDADFPIKYDASIAVTASEDLRISRAVKRDNSDIDKIKERIKNQISDERYRELADFVIENNGGKTELWNKVKNLYEHIISGSILKEDGFGN